MRLAAKLHLMFQACNTLNDAVEGSLKRNKYVRVIFMIESARGLVNIKVEASSGDHVRLRTNLIFIQEIIKAGLAACSESRCRLDSIIFGSDDFCADLGISRSRDAKELLYARQKIVATAKAFGLEAIDMVFIDYQSGCVAQTSILLLLTDSFLRKGYGGKLWILQSVATHYGLDWRS